MPMATVAAIVIVWATFVWYLRKLRLQHIEKICKRALARRRQKTKMSTDDSILDSEGVYGSTWRVHNILTALELKFEAWLAMSARGLFLTYGIPSISSVLHKTGGFQKDVHRRYADMELLIREFNDNAVDNCIHFDGQPERARRAIERLNAIHNEYGSLILYRDMMYVLAVFMTTPAIFADSRWAWRKFTPDEKECIYYHWVDIGNMMNLRVEENFQGYEDVLRYKYEYEKKYMRYSNSNKMLSHSTIDYFVNGVIWRPLRGIMKSTTLCIMSILQEREYQSAALGLASTEEITRTRGEYWAIIYKVVHAILFVVVDFTLCLKALITKYLFPPLPLSWMDRLAGKHAVGGDGSSKCPFSYRPNRDLDFNNRTYTKEGCKGDGEYVLEHMGPKHIRAGLMMSDPTYLGIKEGKVI